MVSQKLREKRALRGENRGQQYNISQSGKEK